MEAVYSHPYIKRDQILFLLTNTTNNCSLIGILITTYAASYYEKNSQDRKRDKRSKAFPCFPLRINFFMMVAQPVDYIRRDSKRAVNKIKCAQDAPHIKEL